MATIAGTTTKTFSDILKEQYKPHIKTVYNSTRTASNVTYNQQPTLTFRQQELIYQIQTMSEKELEIFERAINALKYLED